MDNFTQTTATATGASGEVSAAMGDHVVHATSDDDFAGDLQIYTGVAWLDVYNDAQEKVVFDSTATPPIQSARVPGGHRYRLNVTTYNSTITLTCVQASRS